MKALFYEGNHAFSIKTVGVRGIAGAGHLLRLLGSVNHFAGQLVHAMVDVGHRTETHKPDPSAHRGQSHGVIRS